MSNPEWRVVSQWGDRLAQVLTALAVPMAQNTERMPVDAATPEQVDLVSALGVLGRVMQDFSADAIVEPPSSEQWGQMTLALGWAARLCRQQVAAVVVEGAVEPGEVDADFSNPEWWYRQTDSSGPPT